MLPETGASTMSAPFARTFSASALLVAGLTVLISIRTLLAWFGAAPIPASIPFGPSAQSSSAAALVTIDIVTSAASQTPRGVSENFIPLSISHCALERVRL